MKGFGAIMAEAHMAWAEAAKKEHPRCPLCHEIMEYNGAAWFCYGGRTEHAEWLESRRSAAFDAQERGEVVFWVDIQTPPKYRLNNWDPNMQGVILAVTDDGWQFDTVRGENGVTNFRVNPPYGKDGDTNNPPSLEDWRWADWTGGNNE